MKRISEGFNWHCISTRIIAGFLTAFVWMVQQTVNAADLGTIMPMGDSITLGSNIAGGYRDPLLTLLTSQSDTFTFVGSLTDSATAALTAAGQAHHEGHSGYVITNGTGRTGLDENLATWIGPGAVNPDKILLMIGSNDINLGYDMPNAPTRLDDLITHIFGYRPSVKLYVASIIPMVGHESDVQAFNAAIPGIVASHRALGKDIVYVPMYETLDINTDLADGLHPNALGYQHMADAWDTALHTSSTHAVDVMSAGDGPGLGSTFSVGWDFTVTEAIVIKSLGQFDPESTPTNNTVAIYERGGAKLVEASVFTNSPAELSGNYSARYVPVSDTVLSPGNYVVFSTQNGNNFIAPNGYPAATFGSAITWNKGVAQNAGPLPVSAPASWQINNTNTYRYFGPTFTYDIAPPPTAPALTLDSPAESQSFIIGTEITASATVTDSTGAYTVHIYTNEASGAFAEAGSGSSSSPHLVSLGALPIGTYHIYASVTDTLATTITTTNTFTVAAEPLPGQQILSLTGWNQDIIIGATEAAPEYSVNMGGWNFYESGLAGGTQGLAADSGGNPRTFTSTHNPSVRFQFAPYTDNNAVYLNGAGSVTLNLTLPTKFQSLQFLMTTRSMSWYARLNFSDGSSTDTSTWSDPDWVQTSPDYPCLTRYGLRKATDNSFYTSYIWMAERGFTLPVADQVKTLDSITFTTTGTGDKQLVVFAVSGYVSGSLTGVHRAVDVMSAGGGASGGSTYSVGWDFTVTQPIRVTSLGQFDPDSNPKSNSVAIYQRAGAKLVEATVSAGSPAEQSGNYSARYVPVDTLELPPGNYVVFSTQNGDNYIAPGGSPVATFGPGVIWNKCVALNSGSAAGPLPESAPATWPLEGTSAWRYFGPTFQYELVIPPPDARDHQPDKQSGARGGRL